MCVAKEKAVAGSPLTGKREANTTMPATAIVYHSRTTRESMKSFGLKTVRPTPVKDCTACVHDAGGRSLAAPATKLEAYEERSGPKTAIQDGATCSPCWRTIAALEVLAVLIPRHWEQWMTGHGSWPG